MTITPIDLHILCIHFSFYLFITNLNIKNDFCKVIIPKLCVNLHITFRLYMTVWAGNRALRSKDPCPNCGGEKIAQRALARLRFFVARAAYWRRSIYRPVICSTHMVSSSLPICRPPMYRDVHGRNKYFLCFISVAVFSCLTLSIFF
jgi:hypothetical protein